MVQFYCMHYTANLLASFSYMYMYVYVSTAFGYFCRLSQFPLALPVSFLICVGFLAVVSAVTRPSDVLLGIVIVLATAVPYYVIVVMYGHHLPAIVSRTSGTYDIL